MRKWFLTNRVFLLFWIIAFLGLILFFKRSSVEVRQGAESMLSTTSFREEHSINDFTIVISTYDRDHKLALAIDHWLTCPNVFQVQVLWHDPTRPIPKLLRQMEDEYDCTTSQHSKQSNDACSNCPTCSKRRLLFRQPQTDDLMNRFREPEGGFKTDAVFSVDDDLVIDCRMLSAAFESWKQNGKYAMVGFEPRLYEWEKLYLWKEPCEKCSYSTLFATKGGFLHRDVMNHFFDPVFDEVRDYIFEHLTGEDMLMCFVHFYVGRKFTGKDPFVLVVQAAPGFKERFFKSVSRVIEIKTNSLHIRENRPLKKFQNEGDGNELSGRTAGFRPAVNEMIRNLSLKLGVNEKPAKRESWLFVNNDGSTFQASAVCDNEALKDVLTCSHSLSLWER